MTGLHCTNINGTLIVCLRKGRLATKGTKSTKGHLFIPFVLFVPFVANLPPESELLHSQKPGPGVRHRADRTTKAEFRDVVGEHTIDVVQPS